MYMILMLIVLTFMLTACGSSSSDDAQHESTPPPTAPPPSSPSDSLLELASNFPAMPQGTAELRSLLGRPATFSSGAPFNDLEFTVFDTDYMDGENSGFDVFMPVDTANEFPGSDTIKYVKTLLNIDLDESYGGARGDRIILGTAEFNKPFFYKGQDGIDNDYAVIQHLDYNYGFIQLSGQKDSYQLVWATNTDGVQTEGYYLFYLGSENNDADLIAFIFPCDEIADTISGAPPRNPKALCNSSETLSLDNPSQFIFVDSPSTEQPQYTQGYQLGSNGKEIISGVTADAEGNAYIFGLTDGSFNSIDEGASNKLIVAKIDTSNQLVWTNTLAMQEGTIFKAATADDNYLYAVGRTLGALPNATNQGRWDGIIVKYSLETGEVVASNQYGTTAIDGYGNVTLDDAGNLFVSAQGAQPGISSTDIDYLVAKHDANTLENIWRVIESPDANVLASAEAWGGLTYVPGNVPGAGRIVIGGWYFAGGGADAFVAVYEDVDSPAPIRSAFTSIDPSGTTADWVLDNVVGSDGSVYVAGFTTGALEDSQVIGEGDAYVAKYSQDLSDVEFYQFGTDKADLARKILIDEDDNLYVIGYTYGDLFDTNQDSSQTTADVFVLKLDSDLNPIAQIQIGTNGEDRSGGALFGEQLILGGTTEGAFANSNSGSFDGYMLRLKQSDLTVISD